MKCSQAILEDRKGKRKAKGRRAEMRAGRKKISDWRSYI
jgi:hypothetical protein